MEKIRKIQTIFDIVYDLESQIYALSDNPFESQWKLNQKNIVLELIFEASKIYSQLTLVLKTEANVHLT